MIDTINVGNMTIESNKIDMIDTIDTINEIDIRNDKSEMVAQKNIYSKFCPLRVVTLNADIDESINKNDKINTIIEYFMKPCYGYYVDIMCLQGIRNVRILTEIVTAFKKRINKYNKKNANTIDLEYYPDIDVSKKDDNNIYWSTSESDDDITYYDKLVISRHNILQTADVPIPINNGDIMNPIHTDDVRLMINTVDSDDISNVYKYAQVVNLSIHGIFVSIYNVDLENDSIGISNTKERRQQLRDIKKIIDINRQRSLDERVRQCRYNKQYDHTSYKNTTMSEDIAANRDIHIVTGMFHINEIKNNALSPEYTRMCNILNAFDTHRWIAALRRNTNFYESNVRFTKDTYTLLISKNVTSYTNIHSRSHKLFEEHKIVIISSFIAKNIVDMNNFTNYPEDTLFMLYKPDLINSNQIIQTTHTLTETKINIVSEFNNTNISNISNMSNMSNKSKPNLIHKYAYTSLSTTTSTSDDEANIEIENMLMR